MRKMLTNPAPTGLALLAAAVMVLVPIGSALAAPAFEAPGGITIFSTTTGANVEIDGKSMGKLPFDDSLVVTSGQHTIKVWLRGWTEYIDTFEVKPGEEVELEIDLIPFAGIVKINTKLPGASVKIGGKVEGVTPFDKDIPVGKKVFTISRPGFETLSKELDIKAGELYTLDLELVEIPGGVGGGDTEFYETWWFWTIIGVAGAGAATAVALSSGGEEAPPSASFTLQIP